MTQPRQLEDYVAAGKAMRLAMLNGDGSPVVCNLWYALGLRPDRLWFISRPARAHCANLRRDPRVGGAILAIELDAVGQAVRGSPSPAPPGSCPPPAWRNRSRCTPAGGRARRNAIDPARLAAGETRHRIYQIDVSV